MGGNESLPNEELAQAIVEWLRRRGSRAKPLVLALSGLPGSGKSTLSSTVARTAWRDHGLRLASFSTDDLYLSRAERQCLARAVHPLLSTRGGPGSHDVLLGMRLLDELGAASPDAQVRLPRFDKLADDRFPEAQWPVFEGRPDAIVVDGWFWNITEASTGDLDQPLNDREATEDADCLWRRHQNEQLGHYRCLFERADVHLHLEVPDWETAVRFRMQQEREAMGERGLEFGTVDEIRIRRFMDLFQRIAERPFVTPPDSVVRLNADRLVVSVSGLSVVPVV